MNELVKPRKLKRGDTIATISISGGRAGDADMLDRYNIGKKRLQEIFGLNVVETPNALRGSEFIYNNPKARVEDLM
jgi:muramoyltetrapeptide carboxypeptidase LdcA involved in peptidoglycan recycling